MNNLNNLSDEQINGMIDYLQNILMERGGLKQEPPQNSNYSHNLEETNAQRTQATQENSESKEALLKAQSGQINYVKTRIIQGLKEKNSPFWDKPEIVANKERGHNALNGEAYCNLNDMLLDMEKNRLGFQSNAWVSLEEAKMLGASKEERDAIFKATQNKEISPVRLMFIKNKEPVPLVDNNGELVIDKNTKKPKHKQFAVIENGQKVFKPAYRDIEPQAQFKFVYNYNIEMFPSINKEKIKPLNLDKLSNYAYKTRLFHQKDYSQERRDKTNIIYEDLHRDLSPDNKNEALLERMRSYTLLKNEKYNQLANETKQQTQTRSQSQSYYQKKNKASSGIERQLIMIDKARKNLKDLKSIFLYWYEMFGSNDKSKDMMKAFMKDLAFAKDKNEVIKAQDNELVKEFMQELSSLSFKEQLEFYQTNRDYDPSLDNDENSSELLDAFTSSLENLEKQKINPIREQKRESGWQNNEDNKENSELEKAFEKDLSFSQSNPIPLDKKETSKEEKEEELESKEKEPKETLGFTHSLGVSVLRSRIEEAKNHFNEKKRL